MALELLPAFVHYSARILRKYYTLLGVGPRDAKNFIGVDSTCPTFDCVLILALAVTSANTVYVFRS